MSNPEFLYKAVDPLAWDEVGSLVVGLICKPLLERRSYGDKRPWQVEASATMKLTDCNRAIEWSFTCDESSEGFDIDKAEQLERSVVAFVQKLREAQKQFRAAKKESEIRNKNEGIKESD